MTSYVLGFLFSPDKENVLLIRKNRPVWQQGKLNGVGGHIDGSESPVVAMVREFKEEAGLATEARRWIRFAIMSEEGEFYVHCFAAEGDLSSVRQCTDEKLVFESVRGLHAHRKDMIENLPWLIALAVDCLTDKRPQIVAVTYPRR